jgi:hypothetical protein
MHAAVAPHKINQTSISAIQTRPMDNGHTKAPQIPRNDSIPLREYNFLIIFDYMIAVLKCTALLSYLCIHGSSGVTQWML